MTHAATRLIEASKKSRPMCVRSRKLPRTSSWAIASERVVDDHHVVAVPADAAADVQQDLVELA